MGKISFANSNHTTITMSAVINFPEGFDERKRFPAIVVSHPGGGVKEQAVGTYARKLAEICGRGGVRSGPLLLEAPGRRECGRWRCG
jgi:hypothetical protein